MNPITVIVITGPCGIGKTTLAFAVSELLGARNVPHAVVDMDSLRNCFPSPQNDPFHVQLGLQNLAAIWENYRQVGTECLVLADIVETPDAGDDYRRAVPNSQIVIVRLRASQEEIERRLRGRETESSIEWYLKRSAELSELMEARHIGDIIIDTDGHGIGEVADEILQRCVPDV